MSQRATYTVTKVDERRWGVVAPDQAEPVHTGSFVVVWREAVRMAGRSRPSLVVAVNDEGQVVAREQFDAIEPLQIRRRKHAASVESDADPREHIDDAS